MKKIILVSGGIIVLASLFYFKRQPKETLPDFPIGGQVDQSHESSKTDLSPNSNLHPSDISQEEIQRVPSPQPNVRAAGSEKDQNGWYKNFETALSQNVIDSGMTQEVADCLVVESQKNLKQEKPLDFNALSDSCATKYQLSNSQRDELRNAFRKSVSGSQSIVDIDTWRSCMLSKYKAGSCIPDLIRENVEAFYIQKSGNAPVKKETFEQERQTEIEKILEAALKACPNSLDQLNGVYANECT